MQIKSDDKSSLSSPGKTVFRSPHRAAIVITWVAVSVVTAAMLMNGVRSTDDYQTIRHVMHACYVAVLLWHLARTGFWTGPFPETGPRPASKRRFWNWLPVLGVALLLIFTMASDDAMDILLLLIIVAIIWTIIAWRRKIRLAMVLQGLGLTVIVALAGLPALKNGFISKSLYYLFVGLIIPMYVAGVLLHMRTRFGAVQLFSGRYSLSLRSLVRGVVLFIPLGLINAADGSPGTDITWVKEWWMPFTLPWFSGVAEEILFRMLMMGLCFFLVRPVFRKHSASAVIVTVLFSGIVFGLGHGRTLERFLTTGLLYGVPFAASFAKRDWEHAVGAHYVVNLIPWLSVFVETPL